MNKILIANWKLHKTIAEAETYLSSLDVVKGLDVRIAPPATLLSSMRDHAKSIGVTLGGQNMCMYQKGAYTGEISATMLKDAGAEFVILGHSERRHNFGESNEMIEKKVESAIVEGIKLVICVGETAEEKESGKGHEVVIEQLKSAFSSLMDNHLKNVIVAYEPVWAIGSGIPATKDDVKVMHGLIRDELKDLFKEAGEKVAILYGGSVTPENIPDFFCLDHVDGALVGGASLDPENFNRMIDTTGEYSC